MSIEEELAILSKTMDDLTSQIQEAQIKGRQIENGLEEIESSKNQLSQLIEDLKKEEHDVEKLQSLSFANFFHTLINDKSEQLGKEEEEVIVAKAKVDRLSAEIELATKNIDSLRLEYKKPSIYQSEYHALVKKKTQMILDNVPSVATKLHALQAEADIKKMAQKEIREAISAGGRAADDVDQILSSLSSAANWGTYDMLGGGMLATMAKRSRLDEAQTRMHKFQNQLRMFNRELQDVGGSIDFNIQITEFLGFADWFFDGFFVDWAVQSKINDAKAQMNNLKGKITMIIGNLRQEDLRCRNRVESLERDIQVEIENA